ncbi:MAG: hypothetical protein K2M68_09290 [Muribaculaceae bacterium]|nr:hypothetical protein [Muribaculaceae bacterium]
MKELYIVAQNAFTVSAPDTLRAWNVLKHRFSPFTAASATKPVLEVEITADELTECDAETVYEPTHAGIGVITSRAARHDDGSTVIEFKHIDETGPCLRMKMSPDMNRADIIVSPEHRADDSYFMAHALMIAFMLATCGNGTLLIHSSAVMFEDKAYLFQGKSGTGKSTHATLWVDNIAGAELLNDDNPVIRFGADGVAMAYGSPWSGKTPCYRNVKAPIGAMVRIVRDRENTLKRLAPLTAYASLTASVFYLPFMSDKLKEMRHKTIERLVGAVPCCEMHCRPDAEAAMTCMNGLINQ